MATERANDLRAFKSFIDEQIKISGEQAGRSFQTMLEHDAHELGLTKEDIRPGMPEDRPRKTPKAKEA
jgi:hypothetical protein